MVKKLRCPFTKNYCIRNECALWVSDVTRIMNIKTGKSGIKDTSSCAINKLGEQATMKIWNDTEKLINGSDK